MKSNIFRLLAILLVTHLVACSGGDKKEEEALSKLQEAQAKQKAIEQCLASGGKLDGGGNCAAKSQAQTDCEVKGGVLKPDNSCDTVTPAACKAKNGQLGVNGECITDKYAACKTQAGYLDINGNCQTMNDKQKQCVAEGGAVLPSGGCSKCLSSENCSIDSAMKTCISGGGTWLTESSICSQCKEGAGFQQCRLNEKCVATPDAAECKQVAVFCNPDVDSGCAAPFNGGMKFEACSAGAAGCLSNAACKSRTGYTVPTSCQGKSAATCVAGDTGCQVLLFMKSCTGAGCPIAPN